MARRLRPQQTPEQRKTQANKELLDRVAVLMVKRQRAMAPLMVRATELHRCFFTDEEMWLVERISRDMPNVLRREKHFKMVTGLHESNRGHDLGAFAALQRLQDMTRPNIGLPHWSDWPGMFVFYVPDPGVIGDDIYEDFWCCLPGLKYRTARNHMHVFAEFLRWLPEFVRLRRQGQVVQHALSTMARHCTAGQLVRLWPELGKLMTGKLLDEISTKKVQSKLPSAIKDHGIVNFGGGVLTSPAMTQMNQWLTEALLVQGSVEISAYGDCTKHPGAANFRV